MSIGSLWSLKIMQASSALGSTLFLSHDLGYYLIVFILSSNYQMIIFLFCPFRGRGRGRDNEKERESKHQMGERERERERDLID